MEHFFYQGRTEESDLFWFSESTTTTVLRKPSDFVPYLEHEWMYKAPIDRKNVKKKMVEMLKGRWTKMKEERVQKREKSVQHMLKERMRRKCHKEGYARLHAILPHGTKCDKISIVREAALEIMRTKCVLEDLQRRNMELNEKLAANRSDEMDQQMHSKLKISVAHPVSGIDSMVGVLHCLKDMSLDIKRLSSHFTNQEFSAEIEMDSKIADDEVHRAVQRTLVEVEEKLLRQQYNMPCHTDLC